MSGTASSHTDNVIKPTSNSAVYRMRYVIAASLSVLSVVYAGIYFGFKHSGNGIIPPPAQEFCSAENEAGVECFRSDLFGFQIASALGLYACAVIGILGWHVTREAHTQVPATPEGRLFGYMKSGDYLGAVHFAFQLWDFCVSLTIPEHSTIIFLLHHAAAGTAAWFSLRYEIVHYYSIFFCGISEVSSMFLVFVDLSRFFPPTPGTFFDFWISSVCGPLFALSFFVYRVVLWWKVSYKFFCDSVYVIKTGKAAKLRPGQSFILYYLMAVNIPLGCLQLYWLTLIVKEIQKVLVAGDETHDASHIL